MPLCCVKNCRNSSSTRGKRSSVSFFKFPNRDRSPIRHKQWLKKIGRENFVPGKSSVVCEIHFAESDLDPSRRFKLKYMPQYKTFPRLKKFAVPSLELNSGKSVPKENSDFFREKLIQETFDEEGKNSASIIKTKWKGLRDTFRLELRKYPQESSWAFYHQMMFLRNHIKTRPIKPGEEEVNGIKQEPSEATQSNCVYLAEYEDPDQEGSMSYNNSELQNDDVPMDVELNKDDDYHFLMSFLPEMRKLEPQKKMLLRIKMMELFYKETYEPEYMGMRLK